MKNTKKGLLLITMAMLLASCGGNSSSSSVVSSGEKSSEASTESSTLSISEQETLSSSETSEVPTVTSIESSETSESIEDSSVESESSESSSSAFESSEEPPVTQSSRILRFAYHNDDGKEANYGLWLWADGLNGKFYPWDGPLDENFYYMDLNLSASPFAGFVEDTLYLILRKAGTWDGQSADTFVNLNDYEWYINGDGNLFTTIYLCDGAGQTVEMYDEPKSALGEKFVSFDLADNNTALTFVASAAPEYVNYYVFDDSYYAYPNTERAKHRHDYLKTTLYRPEAETKVTLAELGEESFDPHKSYCITGAFADNISKTRTKFVDLKPIFDTRDFIANYTYDGNDLGCTYDKAEKRTTFKVWAPTSARAEAIVYRCPTPGAINKGSTARYDNDEVIATIPLTDIGCGVFAASYVEKDLKGYGYVYRLYRDGTFIDAVDPYADACGANGKRAAIVDLSETDPEGFEESLAKIEDVRDLNKLTIYEAHIRDLTSDPTWTGESKPGTYPAFIESGTTYQGEKTGFDHIVDMGVDSIQLLPVFDSDNDERTYDRTLRSGEVIHYEPAYNWGYNPVLYNCVEGSYATDPYIPEVRISEYKQLIQAFADHNIRIIMDVVYNHVASVSSSPFNATVPGYYFRYTADGSLLDRTGCSNTFHSYRLMGHRFVVDSVVKWAKNYGIKGFRFDLMAAINFDTMRALKNALYDIDPKIVVYGEPWVGAGGDDGEYGVPGNRWDDVYNLLGDNGKGYVGAFNNGGRDGLKGDTAYANVVPSYGFMNTGKDYLDGNEKKRAASAFMGWNASGNDYGNQNPAQTVNYVSCHDNYTLFDQFNWTLRGDDKDYADVLTDQTAAAAVSATIATLGANLISEGAAFVQGGDEFFRHKVMEKGVYLDDDSEKELRTNDNELYTQMVDSYEKDKQFILEAEKINFWIVGGNGEGSSTFSKEWDIEGGIQMYSSGSDKAVLFGVDLKAGDSFKCVYSEKGKTIDEWYGFEQTGENVNVTESGKYCIYLNHSGEVYISKLENGAEVPEYPPVRVDTWTEGDGIELASGNWLVRNSYKYGDKVNAFDYARLHQYHDECEKVKEAIALRRKMISEGALGKTKEALNGCYLILDESNGDPIIGAKMYAPNAQTDYFVALSGRDTVSDGYNSLTLDDARSFHVDYSSSGLHTVGDEFSTASYGAGWFEFLVCHTI